MTQYAIICISMIVIIERLTRELIPIIHKHRLIDENFLIQISFIIDMNECLLNEKN